MQPIYKQHLWHHEKNSAFVFLLNKTRTICHQVLYIYIYSAGLEDQKLYQVNLNSVNITRMNNACSCRIQLFWLRRKSLIWHQILNQLIEYQSKTATELINQRAVMAPSLVSVLQLKTSGKWSEGVPESGQVNPEPEQVRDKHLSPVSWMTVWSTGRVLS